MEYTNSMGHFTIRRSLPLLYRIQTRQELNTLNLHCTKSVMNEFLRCTACPSEGIALIAEDREDIAEIKKTVDYTHHPCELINRLNGGWPSALYVINNSFTVTLLIPTDIAPDIILQELED